MVPVQISTKVEGKAYTAALRCVIKGQEHVLQVQGEGNPKDSRQRLELQAITASLNRMTKPSEITIKGSGYIKTGFEYLNAWESAEWIKSNKKPVANADLWKQAAEAARKHKIKVFLI